MTRAVELTLIVLIMALPMCLQANPAPTLADLHWMQGSWQGQVGGTEDNPQILEETWSKAAAGTQLAMVRMRTAKQTIFAELITITEVDDGLYLHIQQFAPDMTPRFSPAQRMRLTDMGEQQVTFQADSPGGLQSLTYARKEDNFTIQVMLTEGNQFVAELSAVGDI